MLQESQLTEEELLIININEKKNEQKYLSKRTKI